MNFDYCEIEVDDFVAMCSINTLAFFKVYHSNILKKDNEQNLNELHLNLDLFVCENMVDDYNFLSFVLENVCLKARMAKFRTYKMESEQLIAYSKLMLMRSSYFEEKLVLELYY